MYVAPELELQPPERLGEVSVSKQQNADLIVLPGDTTIGAVQAADWLANGRLIALLGSAAEATWLQWLRSDAMAEHFNNSGAADSSPDPDLLVGYAQETVVSTSRFTWASQHNARDNLVALDEAVGEARQEMD